MSRESVLDVVETVQLLEDTKSAEQWNFVCQMIKKANGNQYPSWWYSVMIQGGKMAEITSKWKKPQ